jgi:hypothetical protein
LTTLAGFGAASAGFGEFRMDSRGLTTVVEMLLKCERFVSIWTEDCREPLKFIYHRMIAGPPEANKEIDPQDNKHVLLKNKHCC